MITRQNWNSSEYVSIRITSPSLRRGQKSPPGMEELTAYRYGSAQGPMRDTVIIPQRRFLSISAA